ncbi:hypothetical protein HPO96_21965 [Kribbella sandramycini]|uniref:PKD domain-containing protein n=1 Tax=Kribbella sandramycini TaxID=60450 RepID=A0A7Y4P096_9ACTN|nr:PKD domain-containing protein [Kribbella sandramycini]MBB6566424.1 hypothetical protein [Kribbella sandramycini]NOL42917.1 hypothetical protein [Kribbella sandramycini]
MIRPGIAAVALTAIVALMPQTAAAAGRNAAVRAGNDPVVVADPTKDGTLIKGTKTVHDRLRKARKKKPGPKEAAQRGGSGSTRHTKDNPRTTIPERVDLNLNIGICGMRQPDGTVPGPSRCQPTGPDMPQPTRRPGDPVIIQPSPEDVTWQQVLQETRSVVFPGLSVKVQPAERTLVNLDTIVYTTEASAARTEVQVLGFPVTVEATPRSYVWRFGDGATKTTTSPGKPYPAKEITHKYMKRNDVSLTLTTNYAARFRVAGGNWQYLPSLVPITGPATALQVREAVPVLVDPPR